MTRPVVPPTPPNPPPEPPRLPGDSSGPPPLPSASSDASYAGMLASRDSSGWSAPPAPGSPAWSADLPARSVRGPRRTASRSSKWSAVAIYNKLAAVWARLTLIGRQDHKAEEQRKRELPAWLVSFIVHVGLILVLALIPLTQLATSRIEMIVGDFDGEGGVEFTLAPQGTDMSLQEVDMPLTAFAANVPEVELTIPAINPSLTAAKASEEVGANLAGLSMEQGLTGRSGSLKGALLAKYGGNSTTEAAVNLGLKWLASQQLSDGSWSLVKNYSDGAVNEDQTAATAMALNAFLGAGHTHKKGDYKDRVARGLKFLTRRQDKEGFFARGEPSHNQMYSQAIATITLCEAYGMTGDSDLKVPASRALKFAQWAQGRQKGWRYEPREDSDLSVTGWYMMALMTGKMAGLEPDEKVIKSVSDYLDLVSHDYGARYSYQRSEPPSLSMTAEGLLCRQYLGWPASHPAMQRAIELDLLPNAPDAEARVVSSYYWYYATQVLHHVGGKAWNEWNGKMRVVLPAMQVKEGKEAGSWDPEKDQWGPSGGRMYTTCFALYCLEVYYRHLALYDLDGNPTQPEPDKNP